MKNINPTKTSSWQKLSKLYQQKQEVTIQALFENNPQRFDRYSIQWEDILVDFSKNWIDEEIFAALLDLANETGVKEGMEAMFTGEPINRTEGRAVLHTALRNRVNREVKVEGKDVMPEVNQVLVQMKKFADKVSNKEWKGYTGKPIKSLVNI